MPRKLRKRTRQSIGERLGSENVMVIVEGATPTLTRAQSASGHRLAATSIALLIVSIPPGLSTYRIS